MTKIRQKTPVHGSMYMEDAMSRVYAGPGAALEPAAGAGGRDLELQKKNSVHRT